MHTLDVNKLQWECKIGNRDLTSVVPRLHAAMGQMSLAGLIKSNNSFGFAVAQQGLTRVDFRSMYNRPYDFVWFVAGWGPDRDRYIANAVRKLRPALCTGKDTLWLRRTGWGFGKVESQEPDGSFEWGDYPYGGAVFVEFGDQLLAGAVSCLTEEEDDAVARLILGLIGTEMYKANA